MTLEIQTNWAKTFDTKHGQVLMYFAVHPENEQDTMYTLIKTPVALMQAEISATEEHFQERATQATAEEFAKNAFDFVNRVGSNTDAAA